MTPLVFHPSVAKDAREIAAKYKATSHDLAEQFWAELDRAIEIIYHFPERHHFDPSGLRRCNLRIFPYHILFEERPGCNRIIVIRHHQRSPRFGLTRQ